ncbi:hypothetical protein [Fibrella forsythiae]|uniref:Sorbosone dehydrogenase family protein n=1 Tax=Fibrella forsythiae TaxID=2817061 RepID=A0ABS3JNX8_9BACT|nr:hypothetical protein [Fibrella forsythiae]MBO0950627.1 hypothetical protein [Fibrella forsythiae]
MRMLSFLTLTAAGTLLFSNCTDKSTLMPTTPIVDTPVSQTIINPAPLPPVDAIEKPMDGWLHPMAYVSLIEGKTSYVSAVRLDALPIHQPAQGELGALEQSNQPVRMIALGGGLDGGST